MKAIQAKITGQRELAWIDTHVEPAPDKILLKGVMSGISAGTETMWYNATASALRSGRRSYPYFPGYEYIGEVIDIGDDITSNQEQYPRLSTLRPGDMIFAFKPHSSFNLISETDLWVKLSQEIQLENAIGLALACTSLHAIHRSGIRIGDDCAVIGMGGLGMTLISCLNAAGAGRITAVSRSEDKRALARDFGANDALDTTDVQSGKSLDPSKLSDIVFECSGKNPGLSAAMNVAGKQGKVIAAGFYTDPMALDGELLFSKELTLYGVRASGAAAPRGEFLRWPRTENLKLATQYLERGFIRTKHMVSHRIKPSELNEAYQMIENGSSSYGQIVINWT